MPAWATFAGVATVVTLLLLVLARASQSAIDGGEAAVDPGESRATPRQRLPDDGFVYPLAPDPPTTPEISTSVLLANVAVTQGLFGAILVAAAWYAEIPPAALGLAGGASDAGALATGVAFGVGLYVANELGAGVGRRLGLGGGETLRAALAPETLLGWVTLLGVVLPAVAAFEEFLFRAALIGALGAGYGVSPWLLAAVSSAAFAIGHGAQGRAGVVVTGLLGFVLAAGFVLTGSLLVVVVAHYLVNALEFVVHEALDLDPVGAEAAASH